MRTIIGLTGYAGVGKDEVAKALVEQRGFVRVGFADPLREAMERLNPIIGRGFGGPFGDYGSYATYNQVVERHGYVEAKERYPELRRLLQVFGTEVGREMFGENFWTDQAKRKIDSTPKETPIVITDVRFPNEVDVIRDYFGVVVYVTRPGFGPVNSHVSDVGISKLRYDAECHNDGTIADLHDWIVTYTDEVFSIHPLI